MYKKYSKCRICKTELKKVISFGKTPIGDFWLNKNEKKLKINKYPLNISFCKRCKLLQLNESVDEKLIYKKFFYEISVTSGLKNHYTKFEKFFTKKFKINKSNKKILDIGSNDGSFLEPFKLSGYNVLGIEPVKKFKYICKKKNIKVLNTYFNKKLASNLKKKNIKFDIISVNFLIANVDYLEEFIESINMISNDKSYLIIETSHVLSVIKKKLYDTFFHEHIFYFSLYNLKNILKKKKFEIHFVEITKSKGGSLRIILKKNEKCKSLKIRKRIDKIIKAEKKYLFKYKVYEDFEKYLDKTNFYIQNLLNKFNNKIVVFGASVASTTIIKKFNLEEKINYFIDDNKLMHSKYNPLNKMPVHKPSKFFNDNKNKTLMIIAIRYTDMIINKYKKYLKNKNIIRIFPNVRLEKNDYKIKRIKSNELI